MNRARARAAAIDGTRRRRRPAFDADLLRERAEAARARLAFWARLEGERGRAALAAPIVFAIGVLIYFMAPDEPNLIAALGLPAVLLIGWAFLGARPMARLVLGGALALTLGFAAAALRTATFDHRPLGAETGLVEITGFVEAVERRANGDRLTVHVVSLTPALEAKPGRVRIAARGLGDLAVGEGVRFRARLRPPGEAPTPGGYDFARDAFFRGVGATGFTIGAVARADLGRPPFLIEARAALERVREAIGARIRAAAPGPSGAIAEALVTGRRDGVPEEINEAMRIAGLYHILSISGFHMALVAAIVFAAVRGGLALAPGLALTRPVKAYAAVAALGVSTVYLLISGAEVATQRSWIMIAIVLIGVAMGRLALSLRTLGVAALGVLALQPESLLGPSFQMSFAATLALVAGYTALRPRVEMRAETSGVGRAFIAVSQGVVGLAASSLLASLATAPIAAYHFHVVQYYGVPGNMMGAPIIEFMTMPLAILALALWPLGLDRPVWGIVGWSLDVFTAVAFWVASWPGGQSAIPAFPASALLVFCLGFLLLTILSTPLRFVGVFVMGLAAPLAVATTRPDVLIDAEARLIAARGPDGRLIPLTPRPPAFTWRRWLEADGERSNPPAARSAPRCDRIGCVAPLQGGGLIAAPRDPAAIPDDCREAAIVVARGPPPEVCQALFVDLDALRWTGAVALRRTSEGFRATTQHDPAASRPWRRPPPAGAAPTLIPARASQGPAPIPDVPEEAIEDDQ